jgi:hypothetical protein
MSPASTFAAQSAATDHDTEQPIAHKVLQGNRSAPELFRFHSVTRGITGGPARLAGVSFLTADQLAPGLRAFMRVWIPARPVVDRLKIVGPNARRKPQNLIRPLA